MPVDDVGRLHGTHGVQQPQCLVGPAETRVTATWLSQPSKGHQTTVGGGDGALGVWHDEDGHAHSLRQAGHHG